MGKTLDISECRELLACFDNKWDGLVLIYLVALADDEGWVDCSVYVMAQRLCLHRQTLNRIIQRLCLRGYVVREGEGGKRLRVCYNVVENAASAGLTASAGFSREWLTSDAMDATVSEIDRDVELPNNKASDATVSESDGKVVVTGCVSSVVTGGVTDLCAKNDALKGCVSGKYENGFFQGVTSVVTGGVSSLVTSDVKQKETKENKEEIPPHPLKKKKNKKKKNHPIIRARERKNRHEVKGRRGKVLRAGRVRARCARAGHVGGVTGGKSAASISMMPLSCPLSPLSTANYFDVVIPHQSRSILRSA